MKVIRKAKQMQREMKNLKCQGKKIGFIPTMGALHEGHLSLIRKARLETEIVVVSIFVNPTQFGRGEDYKEYPRDFKSDKKKCEMAGVDYIFYPEVEEMYPEPYYTYVEVEKLQEPLCGKFRPGHFRGVTTIVTKLFNIVMPDIAYFGFKDYQQYVIIKQMVKDLNIPVKIKGLPIVREKDGLAMSSRNKYLTPEERKEATLLYKSLLKARELIKKGEKNPSRIKEEMKKILLSGKIIKLEKIDYISIVDPATLEELKKVDRECIIALAVRIGKARLIDNIRVKC